MDKNMEYKEGFTIIEILVVIGVLVVIIAFGMSVDLNSFKSDNLQTEEAKVVSLLEKARSEAMSNMFDTTHGVCYDSGNYIIFQTRATCLPTASTDENISANTNIAAASNFSDPLKFPTIVFSRLAGTTTSASITVTDGVKTLVPDITINNEGTISW